MAAGYARFRRETTNAPGNESVTPTMATKVIYPPFISVEHEPGVAHLDRADENRNLNERPSRLTEAYSPTWGYKTRAYPDILAFSLTQLFGAPTTVDGDGVITDLATTAIPAGAYRHRWGSGAALGQTGASPATSALDISYVDQAVYYALRGCAVSDWGIEIPDEGGAQLDVSGPALYRVRQSDPGLTAAYESMATRPFVRGNTTLTSQVTSGSTKIDEFSIKVDNPVSPYRSMGAASMWPDTMEKGDDLIRVSGTLGKRQLDADDEDALTAATGFTLTSSMVTPTFITGSYPYKFIVSCANAQLVSGGPDALENKNRHGTSYEWEATNASGSAGSVVFEVVNATASYA
jgi:hypothetical protein